MEQFVRMVGQRASKGSPPSDPAASDAAAAEALKARASSVDARMVASLVEAPCASSASDPRRKPSGSSPKLAGGALGGLRALVRAVQGAVSRAGALRAGGRGRAGAAPKGHQVVVSGRPGQDVRVELSYTFKAGMHTLKLRDVVTLRAGRILRLKRSRK